MSGPLQDIRVVDFSVVVSGPMATMLLADQGADVIKVEQPGIGDIVRYLGTSSNGVSGLFANNNRGKRSVVLDLHAPDDLETALRLTDVADVVVQNFRPGAADRLGIGYEAVAARNADVVYASISGFGPSGPLSGKRVYDNVIQGYSGAASSQVGSDGAPTVIKQLLCDKVTAMTVAQAVCAALVARSNGAGGQHVEVAMLDAAVAFLWPDTMMSDTLLGDGLTHAPAIGTMYSTTPTADGHITATALSDVEFSALCRALGQPQLATDPRFATVGDRMQHIAELGPLVVAATSRIPTAELIARLEAEDVPCAPIQSMRELADDPQVAHNELLVVRDDPVVGPLRQPRPAATFSRTRLDPPGDVPALGEHTDAIVAESRSDR